MLLEIATLGVLASVLIIEYGTSAHLAKLHQRQLELDNKCQQFQTRFKALSAERKASEAEERNIQTSIVKLETQLEEALLHEKVIENKKAPK
jgi:hypothetical protein